MEIPAITEMENEKFQKVVSLKIGVLYAIKFSSTFINKQVSKELDEHYLVEYQFWL